MNRSSSYIFSQARRLFLLLILIAFSYDAYAQLGNYSERKKFIIESDSVSGSSDLTNFPVLISVTLPTVDVTSPNGYDIAFSDADGTTQLDHQIESYNSSTGELLAWVNFPAVSPNSDTQFFVYYGDSGITMSQDSTSTWDDNYVLVMHMNGPITGTESDATQYGNDGTINEEASPAVVGIDTVLAQIGYGRDFEWDDREWIQIADDATLDITGEITLSFWINHESTRTPDYITKGSTPSYEATSRSSLRMQFRKNGGNNLNTGTTGSISTWYYYTFVQTSSGREIYRNGIQLNSDTNTDAFALNNDPVEISRFGDGIDGILDEVRISDIDRSEDWIKTEYNNQLNPTSFIEELPDVPGLSNVELSNQEYTAGGSAVFLTNTLTVDTHPTITTLDSVVIQITGNFESGGDDLNYTDGTIVGTYNSTTGKLLLENSASLSAYQTAIRSVTFSSSLGSPSSLTRTVTFTGYSGTDASNTVDRDLDIVTVLTALDDLASPVFYLNALDLDGDGTLNSSEVSPPLNNSAVSTWGDISANGFDFVSGTDAVFDSLAFGERGAVLFVPNDELQKTVETAISNSIFTEKTFAFIVRTGTDLSGFQMLYEQSNQTRGYNFSIVDGSLYAQAYSRGDGNWGDVNADRHRVINLGTVSTNTTYYVVAYHDSSTWNAQINDGILTELTEAAEMPAVSQTSAIGGGNGDTRHPVTLARTAAGNFDGNIAEIATWNSVFSGGQIQSINNYFEDTWGNTPPVLSGIEGPNIDFSENDPDTLITTSIVVTDSDPHNNLDSARVSIFANYSSGEDVLTFTNFGNITGNFNSTTGVLSLTGSDTKANYQTALRSVRYQNAQPNPTTNTRTVDFIVYDWDDSSNVQSRNINVIDLEFSPTVTSIEAGTLTFTEGDSPVAITSTIVADDADDTNLAGATISISSNFTLGEDELAFTDFGNISGSWNGTTGVLTLSGSDSKANYQTALRSITYENLSSDPIELTKTISFSVTDGTNTSNTETRDIDVVAANSKPELTGIETSNLLYEDVDVQITNTIVVSDPDDTQLDSALVVISENYKSAEDSLIYSTLFGITGTWNSSTGVLKLEGTNSLSDYQAALRSVQYSNTATIASGPERVVSFIASDGDLKSDSTKRTIDVSPVETIPDLEVWLRADVGISEADGVPVTTWEDQSGNGNDYVGVADVGTAPVYESSSTALNGQPSVIFAGNGDHLEDSDGFTNYIEGATEFSLFVVFKSDITSTDRGLFNAQVPNNDDKILTIRYDQSGANGAGAFTNVVKTGILTNAPDNQLESFSDIQTTTSQIVSLQWDSGTLYDLYVDGILNNPSSAADPPPSGTISDLAMVTETAILGKGAKDDPSGTDLSWDGEIAEFIYYSRSLNDEERESVEDYLSEKYDVPIRKITPATGGESISADDANTTFTALSGPFIQEGFIQELTFGGTIVFDAPSGFEWNTSGSYGTSITPAYGGTTALDASFTSVTSSQLTFTIDDTSTSASSPGQIEFTGLEIRPTTGILPNTGNITNTGTTGQGGATNYGTITMVPGTQDSLSFIVQPSATNVDSTVSPPVRVQLVDQFGNEVEQSGITINTALSSGSGTLSGSSSEITNALGIAEFDSLIFDEIGTKELEATSTGLSPDTSSTFEIVNAGTLTSFLVERDPSGSISSKTAGQTFNIKLTAQDGTSTTVTTFNGTVVVSSGCTLGTGQGTTSNFTSGVLSGLTVSVTSVGVCDITVTNSTGPETGTSNTFTVSPGAADVNTSTITASPTVILNDGSSTSVLTVQLIDTYGNNLTSGGSTVVLSATQGTLTLGGSGASDNADGTYSDTLTSSTSEVTSTITGTVDAVAIVDDAEVEFAAFTHIWDSQLGSASLASDWEDTGNWNTGTIPGPSSVVLVPANPAVGNEFPVIDEAGASVSSLSMETGATLTISGGINFTITGDISGGSVLGTNADSLTIGGDILNVSAINVGTVILDGSTAQTITNPHSYTNLEIDNPGGVSIEQNLTISDTLRLNDGELLVPSGVNVIADGITYGTGLFRFQRTITGSRGWRMLSSPVASTYGDFLDGVLTQGYTGSTLGNAPLDSLQPNVLTYLESFPGTDNQRYRAPTSTAQSLTAGQGIFVFFFDTVAADSRYNDALPDTIDVSGQEFPTSGNEVDFGITYTTTADSGWNFVGNPFGAAIDWDDGSSWTKTNVESTIYIWDPAANGGNGEYLTWNGSTGTLGSGLISPFQGFWVKANAASPDLRVTTDAKTTGGTFLRKEATRLSDPPTFALRLSSGELQKSTVFMFSENARLQKDDWDAYELSPFSVTRLEVFSTLSNGLPLAINNLPDQLTNRYLIPIHVNGFRDGAPISGDFTIRAINMDDLPEDWLILLIDNVSGQQIDLAADEQFTFFHTTTTQFKTVHPIRMKSPVSTVNEEARFTLKITTEEIEANIPQEIYLRQNYPNPFNPATTINYGIDVNSDVLLEIYDVLGRRVQILVNETQNPGKYNVRFNSGSLSSGIYFYRLSTATKTITRRMTLIK